MANFTVSINGESYAVQVKERRGNTITFDVDGETYTSQVVRNIEISRPAARLTSSTGAAAPTQPATRANEDPLVMRAPIPGIVSEIKVAPGDVVDAGVTLIVIEAMKMENPIRAPRKATIEAITVKVGEEITNGTELIRFARDAG